MNRQVVVKTLTRIRERLSIVKNTNGLIVFAGVDEFNQELLEVLDLKDGVRLDVFYYNCSNRFDVDFPFKYLRQHSGSIVFANGAESLIYAFEGGAFRRMKHIVANLQKRQRKGGMSSLRIARLAEESRHSFVVRVVDYLNTLSTETNWIFGSDEILGLILSNRTLLTKLKNGGFLDFNSSTINDQNKFLGYLQQNNSDIACELVLKDIQYYLDTNPDMLDFDLEKRNSMKFFLMRNPGELDFQSGKYISLPVSSKYYASLRVFEYIGLKYFTYDDKVFENDFETVILPSEAVLDTEDIRNIYGSH